MLGELKVKYLEFRRQLHAATSELAAERVRRQAYAFLLNELQQNNVELEEIGEISHQFLYLEELDRRLHNNGWVDYGLPMLCPGNFGKFVFTKVPESANNGDSESADDFYELRFFNVHGNEIKRYNMEALPTVEVAIDVAKSLLSEPQGLFATGPIVEYVGPDSAPQVAVIAVSVHGKNYADLTPIPENAIVWYSDLSKFVKI